MDQTFYDFADSLEKSGHNNGNECLNDGQFVTDGLFDEEASFDIQQLLESTLTPGENFLENQQLLDNQQLFPDLPAPTGCQQVASESHMPFPKVEPIESTYGTTDQGLGSSLNLDLPSVTEGQEDIEHTADYSDYTSTESWSSYVPQATPEPSPSTSRTLSVQPVKRGRPRTVTSPDAPIKPSTKKQFKKDTEEYRVRRDRNNIAVRKSRTKSRQKQEETELRVKTLQAQNSALQNKVALLSKELSVLRNLITVNVQPTTQ